MNKKIIILIFVVFLFPTMTASANSIGVALAHYLGNPLYLDPGAVKIENVYVSSSTDWVEGYIQSDPYSIARLLGADMIDQNGKEYWNVSANPYPAYHRIEMEINIPLTNYQQSYQIEIAFVQAYIPLTSDMITFGSGVGRYFPVVINTPPSPVPEPTTMLLLGLGLIGLAGARRSFKK